MKHFILSLAILTITSVSLFGQKIPKQDVQENQVPQSVRDTYNSSIGLPAEKWVKLTINNQPRYVAVAKQMNQSSGKLLEHHYRYTENGKATSDSEYRGNGKNEAKDFFVIYFGTGPDNPSLQNKVAKLLAENTLISFEGFGFTPGNQASEHISTQRFVLKDKSAKTIVLYFDNDGKEVDMTKYPVRSVEATELD